ncbi:hypothetical protein N431DRAFT_460829 [Stipitochalara longipes BDJ]|nr:hypothetical protein N431DRAFT_460829 [Stipitochalara longipes BDJ]
MEYASQFGVMRQKAAEEKRSFVLVLEYYRGRLLQLHTSCPDMPPSIQQYRAEYQTWSSFWPEQPFPGIEPILPIAPPPAPPSTGTPSVSGDLELSSTTPDLPARPIIPGTANLATAHPGLTPQATQAPSFPQISASGEKVTHKTKTQEEIISEAVPQPVERVQYCGACYQKGHQLRDCTHKTDPYGFLNGCPRCNTTRHNFDQCGGHMHGKNKGQKSPSNIFYLMVVKRIGKPPIRSAIDFRFLNPERFASLERYPQTCQFAAARRKNKIMQEVHQQIDDPSWVNPESIGSQVHPWDAKLQRDRDTIVKPASGAHSSTPVNILTEDWAQEANPTQPAGSSTSYRPAAPTLEVQPAAHSPFLQVPVAHGAIAPGCQVQFNDARPNTAAGNPQHQSANDAILPSPSPASKSSQMFPCPSYAPSKKPSRATYALAPAPAPAQYMHCPPQQPHSAPYHSGQSFSGYASTDSAPWDQRNLPQGPSVPCENCGENTHHWTFCNRPCSSCDGDSHQAPQCPFSSANLHVPAYN